MLRVDAGRTGRIFTVVDGRPRTAAIVADGAEAPVDAVEELALVVDGRRWSDADMAPSEVELGPGSACLSWTLRAGELAVRMVVAADAGAGVVRKWAEITGAGRVERVELERWRGGAWTGFDHTGEPVPYNAGPPGLGQPVFGPGLFVGIEHPVAENLVEPGGGCGCALPVVAGLGTGTTPFRTPASVVGAGGLDDFWDYVDTLRPVPARLVTLTNNWYHLGATGLMDAAAVAAEVDGFAQVGARHGLTFDFHCLDDGWEGDWDVATGLWGRMAPGPFPSGLAGLGDRIGLWLSPFGGYGERRQARVAWAAAHGLEVERPADVLCPAGTRYRAHLVEAVERWTRAGVGYWKLDGVRFVCDDASHGHPVGPGARTAQVDAFLALVRCIRAVRPDAVVAFTIGSHPSPWWLASVDFVWRGGLDDTAADHPGSRLERFDSYIDTCLHAYRAGALPVSALVTFSVVESAVASYREPEGVGGLDAWERHCWLAAARGTLHQDLYVAPDSLSDAEWSVLARALAWARSRQDVLARSRMVLGNPGAGEVYGFATHRRSSPQPAVVCIRNPGARSQAVDLDWPALFGFPSGTVPVLSTRYGPDAPPDGRLTLEPLEVVVVEGRGSEPATAGPGRPPPG